MFGSKDEYAFHLMAVLTASHERQNRISPGHGIRKKYEVREMNRC